MRGGRQTLTITLVAVARLDGEGGETTEEVSAIIPVRGDRVPAQDTGAGGP